MQNIEIMPEYSTICCIKTNYYCPLNFDVFARMRMKKNWADSRTRISPFGYLCSFQTKSITKSWAKVHIFSDSRYWVSC